MQVSKATMERFMATLSQLFRAKRKEKTTVKCAMLTGEQEAVRQAMATHVCVAFKARNRMCLHLGKIRTFQPKVRVGCICSYLFRRPLH